MGDAPIKVVASPVIPEGRFLLVVGKLSYAAQLERERRVKAGERDIEVYAELLIRERKGIVG